MVLAPVADRIPLSMLMISRLTFRHPEFRRLKKCHVGRRHGLPALARLHTSEPPGWRGRMADKSFVELGERGLLVVAGEDRRAFLQGLISNDVEKATPERAIHAALLTAQGKYLHDFFVAALGETLILECEATRLPDLQRRLSMYKLRAKVTLGPASGDLAVFAVF